ncbi:hypothetical protein NDU88_000689 [Pleurodeles waltl]|uniref:Uncharacterized protein n=1 Tax=Pleurodeles waltl TaxID=8319 RepID=A0AAV7UQP8_PLEWA|nr:hypothetical protein NDU88_000689 [Pleurodeles waltl]
MTHPGHKPASTFTHRACGPICTTNLALWDFTAQGSRGEEQELSSHRSSEEWGDTPPSSAVCGSPEVRPAPTRPQRGSHRPGTAHDSVPSPRRQGGTSVVFRRTLQFPGLGEPRQASPAADLQGKRSDLGSHPAEPH